MPGQQRCHILLRFERRFHHATHRLAALHRARHLRNYKADRFQLRMMLAVTRQALCNLFWGTNAQIADNSPMQRAGIIEINNSLHEIGAVARQQLVHPDVSPRIQNLDQLVILLRTGFDFEGITRAIVGRPEQLIPRPFWHTAIGRVRNEFFKMLPPVLVPQKGHQLRIGVKRNLFGQFDSI